MFTLTLHKIRVTTFCCICNKRLSRAFRVIDSRSFPVVVRTRHKSSAMACQVRLKLHPRHQLSRPLGLPKCDGQTSDSECLGKRGLCSRNPSQPRNPAHALQEGDMADRPMGVRVLKV